METLKKQFWLWILTVSLVICFLGCGWAKYSWRSRQAETFIESAARQLDSAKQQGHPYPPKLPADLSDRKPKIVDYSSDGKYYIFSYTSAFSFSIFSTRYYQSRTHNWTGFPD
jgi:hypothetical protein